MKNTDEDFDESELFDRDAIASKATGLPNHSENPLAGYFRLPGLMVTLPTGGRYLPPNAITLDLQGQLEIYPMRSADELLLKSPDALMSGLAIERMFESCVPGIKTPKLISAPDMDVIFLAIRAATYGNIMPVDVVCPECDHENSFECDLTEVLQTMKPVPDVLELRLSKDVVVTMKPHTLGSQTKLLLAAYAENRRAQEIDSQDLDEDSQQQELKAALDRMNGYHTASICDSIVKVSVPTGDVVDRNYIKEFVEKTTKSWADKLRNKVEEINSMGLDRHVKATCAKCHHEWDALLEFNPATFFEQGSSD